MQFPKLTPLQSRFAASFAASLILVILFLTVSRPQFVYAFEADLIEHRDHNHPFLLDRYSLTQTLKIDKDNEEQSRVREFVGLDWSLVRRAAPDPLEIKSLSNNIPGQSNYTPGGPTQVWSFLKAELEGPLSPPGTEILPANDKMRRDHVHTQDEEDDDDYSWQTHTELRKRQDKDRTYYLTLNVCDQPTPTTSDRSSTPPPLQVYISHDSKNPGSGSAQYLNYAANGYFDYSEQTADDIYVGVDAPNDPMFQGQYNYELTISIDSRYAAQPDYEQLYHLDSDSQAGLFVSENLTDDTTNSSLGQAWMDSGSPFSIFVHNQNDVTFTGLMKSFCGLKKHAQIKGNIKSLNTTEVEVKMTTLSGGFPKEQFLVKNLNSSSQYHAIMALESNYSNSGPGNVNGGGTVWNAISFSTKAANSSCQLLYNLDFCDGIGYAVPTNSSYYDNYSGLASIYDNNAKTYFQNFQESLDQIPCNTTASAQYSLAVDCTACSAAYKQWLCADSIPRCTDFSSPESFLQPRRINYTFSNNSILPDDVSYSVNSSFSSHDVLYRFNKSSSSSEQYPSYLSNSRNPFVDTINPGPYKEILPCKSLCSALVRDCHALLGLAGCPSNISFNYGIMGDDRFHPECSIPGMILGISRSTRVAYNVVTFWAAIMIAFGTCIIGVY